ncbi:2-succinyl-6-hydroxy-2,4-cyclohexadiene-1-carboxylate synthase [Ornithinibacillus halophilus]|uniref:Putative 2-succinyl-6-hydroxy-2,4-cyclohexadiene-1-carboxylate synthase n=2 Tax=Ornithinibacillus halophilus TaxID=930117 RepID=A0A1M5K6Q1_9BACI|nr:2-succinyl-6-hydroxy-2,4-cyclohexadiene-1-carboxylate synthase [Ornithinibacillus halophilus]
MNCEINGTNYWYEVNGTGDPVVMLHGFTGSTKTWSDFITKWSDCFQIIAIDLPGHGKTSGSIPKTMEECCNDLSILFKKLSIDKFHLVGYSMGGRTALSFTMLYPNMVQSLILESASPGLEIESEQKDRIRRDEKLAQKIEREGIKSFVDFWENIPLFETQKRLPTHIQQQIRDERLSQSEKGLATSLRFMGTGSQPSWWDKLSNLSTKVLLLAGDLDTKFVTINTRMNRELPNSELRTVKKAGHAIHVEQSEMFGKIVTEFILGSEIESVNT